MVTFTRPPPLSASTESSPSFSLACSMACSIFLAWRMRYWMSMPGMSCSCRAPLAAPRAVGVGLEVVHAVDVALEDPDRALDVGVGPRLGLALGVPGGALG